MALCLVYTFSILFIIYVVISLSPSSLTFLDLFLITNFLLVMNCILFFYMLDNLLLDVTHCESHVVLFWILCISLNSTVLCSGAQLHYLG